MVGPGRVGFVEFVEGVGEVLRELSPVHGLEEVEAGDVGAALDGRHELVEGALDVGKGTGGTLCGDRYEEEGCDG